MDKKICPVCGEEISATARKCPYCNEWIDASDVQPASSDTAACASTTIDENPQTLTYSKGLVGFLIGVTIIGMLLDSLEGIMPSFDEFEKLTGGIVSVTSSIMVAVGMSSLLIMYGRKIASDGIRNVSGGLVTTTAVLSAISNLASISDSTAAVVVLLVTSILCLIFWLIVGVQSVKVEKLKQIGMWMIISIVLATIVLVIVSMSDNGGKGFAKVMILLYLFGYVKMFDKLKKYLCPSE